MANRAVVFIHGLGGSAIDTWGKFSSLLKSDLEVSAWYKHIESFQYVTSAFRASLPLSQIAHDLALFIEKKVNEQSLDEIAFITHSQGGLLARRYLCDHFQKPDRLGKMPIFRLLTFATPHWGAYSKLIGDRIPDSRAQTRDLAFDADAILLLNKDWATASAEDRLRILRVVASDDAIVPKFSAIGAMFNSDYRVINGYGHIDVVKVNDITHPSFEIAKTFLLETTSYQPSLVNDDRTPPLLSLTSHDSGEIAGNNRFIYSTRYVEFVGREREKAHLMEFLLKPADKNVSWVWMKGEGGVGKSRLALEFCLACQADWHAGFLNKDAHAPDWARWQPQLPTLIVVDYATTDVEQLGRMLRGVCNRDSYNQIRRPLRILLLDRQQQEDRLAIAMGEGRDRIGINACRNQDLDIGKIDEPWLIIESFLARSGASMPVREDALARLTLIDPAQRPLFAMLLADMLLQTLDLEAITRESLLENVLARERIKYWRPAALEQQVQLVKMERLLAFATIVNGLALSQVRAPLEPWDPDIVAPVFNSMSAYDQGSDTILPLAPDLIGECLALEVFKIMAPQKKQELISLAWDHWPVEAFSFFDRVSQDFPNDTILNEASNAKCNDRRGRSALSQWLNNLISRTGTEFPERDQIAFDKIALLAHEFPEELILQRQKAKAAFLMIIKPGTFDLAASMNFYDVIKEISNAHASEVEIKLWQARSISYLVEQIGPVDSLAARDLLSTLIELAATHLTEPAIRSLLATATLSLIVEVAPSNSTFATSLFDELRALARMYPGEQEIQITYVDAIPNVISVVFPEVAYELLQDIRAVTEKHPEKLILAQIQATALFNLLIMPGSPHSLIEERLADLKVLALASSANSDIRLLYAKAVANLIADLGEALPHFAQNCLLELQLVAEDFMAEVELQVRYARAVSHLFSVSHKIDEVIASAMLNSLNLVAEAYQEHPEILKYQARANFSRINALRNTQVHAALALCEDLRRISLTHPNNPEIRLYYVKSICNIMPSIAPIDSNATLALLENLRKLSIDFSDEPEVLRAFSKALTNLIGVFSYTAPNVALDLLEEIETLAESKVADMEIQVEEARATFNLITGVASSNLALARRLLVKLRKLAATYSHEPRIRHAYLIAANNLMRSLGPDELEFMIFLLNELFDLVMDYPNEFEAERDRILRTVEAISNFVPSGAARDM